MINNKKIFKGEKAITSYLLPGTLGLTPVVELPSSINLFEKDNVRIFVKLVQFVPLSNIKSLPAYMMLDAISKKKLSKIKNLVEYSSGNTVLSLAILARHFGIPNMHAIITPDVPEHKKRLLQLVGANLLISHGPASPGVFDNEGGIYDAKMLGEQKDWHNLHQYINKGNTRAAKLYVGRELWKQLGNKLCIFVASIGTAGTIVGAGGYLKKKIPKLFILGTAIKEGSKIPGPRGEVAIHKLGIEWENVVDEVMAVDAKSAFTKSLELIRLGLFVGPSTGMQLHALLKKLEKLKKKKILKKFQNKDGEIICSIVACDTMFPYIDEYFTNLPKNMFPKIKHLKKNLKK